MSTHKLLAVGAAGAIGYMFYRWSSIPDTSQDESQQIPTETGSAQTDISHSHDTTESSRELEYVQQVADDKIGEQPRVEGTAMLGNKNNGTAESSSKLRSVHQTAGDKMSSDVEQPGVIKTGSQASSDITVQQLNRQDNSLHEERGASNTNESQERMNLPENDTEDQQPRKSNRSCDTQQSLETDEAPFTPTHRDFSDVFERCDIINEGRNLQEPSSLPSFSILSIRDDTSDSSEQSGNLLINTQSGQTQISPTIQCDLQYQNQLDDRNLQTLKNDIPSTSSAQPLILGNQNVNNQTRKIGRNDHERGQRQEDAVETSGDVMRNSEYQNLQSSLNSEDNQAAVMMSHSTESSSTNNISTGNDQRGQGYQSSTETLYNRTNSVPVFDAVPYNSSSSKDLENERDIADAVVLHADDDREAAKEFIANMEREFPDLNLNITIYETLTPGKYLLGSAANLYDNCRFLFVFVTQNFVNADLPRFLNEISLIETITFQEKNNRLIPVSTDNNGYLPELAPLIPLNYKRYLQAKSEQKSDSSFLRSFKMLITDGRKKYLVN